MAKRRCPAMLRRPRKGVPDKIDSWRCQMDIGHSGDHESFSGRRRWPNRRGRPLQTHQPTLL